MPNLSIDQGGTGQHKCAACAYEQGLVNCTELEEEIDLKNLFNPLDESQAKEQIHKSPHTAYVKGYFYGVKNYYKNK